MLNEHCLWVFSLINCVVGIESGIGERLRWRGHDLVFHLHHLSIRHKVGWDWLRRAVYHL